MTSVAELADRYAVEFILDHTEYAVDGIVHQQLIGIMLEFYEEAINQQKSKSISVGR